MAERRPRSALVGLGAFGQLHLEELLRADTEVVGIADGDLDHARRVAQQHGVDAFFGSLSEMLDVVEPDCVSIVTSNPSHAQLAAEAARRGCKVLLEKPIALGLAELAEIDPALSGSIMPAHILRFEQMHRTFRRLLEDGRIGAVLGMSAERSRSADHRESYADTHLARMTATHDIDLVHWLSGSTVRSVTARTYGRPPSVMLAQLQLDSGPIAQLRTSWVIPRAGAAVDRLVVYGERGIARLHVGRSGCAIFLDDDDEPWADLAPQPAPGLDAEIDHFVRWVAGEVDAEVDFAAGARAVAVADALVASASEQGEAVAVARIQEEAR